MPITESGLRVAEAQLGVLTRRQLLAAGVTKAELRWKVGRTWRLLLPGVVLLDAALPSDEQRMVAALQYAGSGAWLAGSTAAALHGVPGFAVTRPIHVLVPAPRRNRVLSWVSIRATSILDERIIERGPLRLSCLARAVVDAAAAATAVEARAIIIAAVQRRLVRIDDLAHWVHARELTGRAQLLAGLRDAAEGAWSVPEADLLRLIESSQTLPEAWANPAVTDAGGKGSPRPTRGSTTSAWRGWCTAANTTRPTSTGKRPWRVTETSWQPASRWLA